MERDSSNRVDLQKLPLEIQQKFALYLTYPELVRLCTQIGFRRICADAFFWRQKLERDFSDELFQEDISKLKGEEYRAQYELLLADQINQRIYKLQKQINIQYEKMSDEINRLKEDKRNLRYTMSSIEKQVLTSGKARPSTLQNLTLLTREIDDKIKALQEQEKKKSAPVQAKIKELRKSFEEYRTRAFRVLPPQTDMRYLEIKIPSENLPLLENILEEADMDAFILEILLKQYAFYGKKLHPGNLIGIYIDSKNEKSNQEWPRYLIYIVDETAGDKWMQVTLPGQTDLALPQELKKRMRLSEIAREYKLPFDIYHPPGQDETEQDVLSSNEATEESFSAEESEE